MISGRNVYWKITSLWSLVKHTTFISAGCKIHLMDFIKTSLIEETFKLGFEVKM